MNKNLYIIRFCIGFFILLVLAYLIGFKNIYYTLLKINPVIIPFLFIIIILQFLIGALNVKILTIPLQNDIAFYKLFKYSLLVWSVSLFVPGRIGEFSLIYFLNKEKIKIGEGTTITILDRLITLLCLSIFAILGFLLFFTIEQSIYLSFILFIFFLITMFFIISETGRSFIKDYILREYSVKFEGFSKTLHDYLKNQKKIIAVNIIITVIKLAIGAFGVSFTFLLFGEYVPFLKIFIITAMVTIISLIPLSISGLGLKEAGAVYFYNLLGIGASVTMSVYIFTNILNYTLGIFSIALWFKSEKR